MIRFFREHVWSALPAEVPLRQRRIAALAWPVFLAAFAAFIAWNRERHGEPFGLAPFVLITLAPVLAILLAANERAGIATYRAVMLAFITFGFFVSHIIMTVFFYFIVTPLGFFLRATGKDLIDSRKNAPPQWIENTGIPERRRFYRLF